MGGQAKSGTHLAVAIQVLTFFFSALPMWVQFTLNSTHNGVFSKKEKKGKHLLSCPVCVTFSPNRHQARVPCHIAFAYRGKRLNTVVLDMLAD